MFYRENNLNQGLKILGQHHNESIIDDEMALKSKFSSSLNKNKEAL